jgi:WD40 repeat protein
MRCLAALVVAWIATSPASAEPAPMQQGIMRDLVFLPDNYDSAVIKLVTIADGKVARLPSGHTLGITTLAWSPDGTQIASGARDKTIRLRGAAEATR